MKKRILALFLAALTLAGLFALPASAAPTLEEAMADVDVYARKDPLTWLTMNGSVKTQFYTYYLYESPSTGQVKEIPAYCVDPRLDGVPKAAPEGTAVKYSAESTVSDEKIAAIISNGYPHMTLADLNLKTVDEAYYATKTALWCYLRSDWSVDKLGINPDLDSTQTADAQRVLQAVRDIYWRGMNWEICLTPRLTAQPDRDTAYLVTVNGQEYYQQIFTITSDTWPNDRTVFVSLTGDIPEGTQMLDESGNPATKVITDMNGENGYQATVTVRYPASSVEGQSGTVQLMLQANVVQYAIYYAKCMETDKYGNLQHYMLDTDPLTPLSGSAISSYVAEESPDTPEPPPPSTSTGLKIIKLEEGTNIPLEGAVFKVTDPNGRVIGSFSTGRDGTVTIPCTMTGHHTVEEITPPKWHLLDKNPIRHVQVNHGETAVVTFTNPPYGNLRVEKVSDTGEKLAGATFQIKHIATGETQTAQTGPGGAYTFTELAPGGYEVREIAGISGWQADTETVQTVAVVSGETSTVTFTNKELPGLRIVKYDRTTLDTMPDVTFEIWHDGESLGRFKTDELGEIVLLNAAPGTYLVQEVQSDNDHITETTPQMVELHAGDGIRQLVFFNDLKPGIHLIKVDSADLSKPIPNAVFEIKSVAGDFGPEEFRTNEHGEIDLSRLPIGAYVVTEKSCPGYIVDEAQRIIQLDGNENAQFVFTNSVKPSLYLKKLSADGTPLAGVSFRLSKIEDGTFYLDRTTNAQGEIMWEGLEPGVYSLIETATTADHILDKTEYHVELFPGKTSEKVIQNDRRPNLIVYKHDADTAEPISDTVFQIKAADGHSVDEIRTDSTGKAVLENLLPGVYQITEKSVPSDWLLDAPSQLVTLYPNRDHTAYFEDHKKPGLTVQKVDSITGQPIQGARFQVWYASNSTTSGELNDLGYFYSDEKGQFSISDLRDGWYKITEVEPAAGYALKDPSTQEVYIRGGESKTVVFENTPLSALVVWKYDSVTGQAVEGAVFQVKYLSSTSGTGGTVIGTYRTSASGSFTVTGLSAGAYIVEELASDSGHVVDAAPQTAYISGKDQDVVQLYFGNSPKGALLVKKVDATTGAPLSDVEFLVTDSTGAVVGDANGKFVTDSAGTFTVSGIEPGTTLIVRETRARDSYLLDEVPQTAKINAGQTVTLEFRNQPFGNLVIHKLSSLDKTPLEGVQFKLTYADGKVVDAAGGKLSSNGLYWTNAEGQIIVSGVTGTIIATEVTSVPGFAIDPNTHSQTVVINPGDDTQHLYFYNDPLCSLTLTKLDSTNGKPIPNTTFSVKDGNGNLIGRYTTGADGTVTVTGLLPGSTVVVSEYKVPDAYVLDPTPRTIMLKSGSNAVTSSGTGTDQGGGNGLVFENDPKMTLTIHKYIKGTNYEPLAGVCFMVMDGSGKPVGSGDGTFYTNSAGEIVVEGLEPGTIVIAREISTVEGFVLDGEPKSVQITASNKAPELIFWNEKAGSLVVQKKSSLDGSPLAGVQFLLTYADGSYVDADNGHMSSKGLYETDAAGEIRITGITGTVIVKEVKCLPGYTIDLATCTQTVQIDPDDCQTLVFYNTPVGNFELIKVNEANRNQRIPNTTFEIRRMDGSLVDTVTTDKNGRVFIPLDAGDYYAMEIEAAKGFRLDSIPHYFTVKDGQATTLTVTNEPASGILLHKVDSTTGKGIYGVSFLLYDSGHNPIGQYVSDQSGYVYIEDLTAGRYYLRELENEGYILDSQLKTVYVKAGETTEVTWKNTPVTGQIQITKTSADYNSVNGWPAGTPIPGTVFEIYSRAGNLVDTVRTDKNGVAISKPLPLGRYTLVESKAADFYALDKTPIDVEIEFEGQIVRTAMTDRSLYTNVSIKKTGYVEVMPGQMLRYDFSDIGNNSTVPLFSFFWRDTLPTQAVRLDRIVTGTYNVRGSYKVVFKTNLNGEYRTMYDNLDTQRNYVLDASTAALGLASNEYITEFMVVFGTVPAGFRQVEAPRVYCTVLSGLAGGTQFTNQADVGGVYDGQWIMAVSRWVTRVYAPAKPLPRTGY